MDCFYFNNILIQIFRFAYSPITNSMENNSSSGFQCNSNIFKAFPNQHLNKFNLVILDFQTFCKSNFNLYFF